MSQTLASTSLTIAAMSTAGGFARGDFSRYRMTTMLGGVW
jgi:hypothetical protein